MLPFQLNNLTPKKLFKDVIVRLIEGEALTLNYFELKSTTVAIPFHEHPVEHLVVILDGQMEFLIEDQQIVMKECEGLFLPAKTRHSARVIRAPVKALEICTIVDDQYYNGRLPSENS